MEECVFCKVIKGEIPAQKVYEDESALAFMDLTQPKRAPCHVLVIPKAHIKTIYDADSFITGHIFNVARKVAKAVKKSYAVEGILIWQSNERASGQVIEHMHVHVFPNFEGDGYEVFGGKLPERADAQTLATACKQISSHLE